MKKIITYKYIIYFLIVFALDSSFISCSPKIAQYNSNTSKLVEVQVGKLPNNMEEFKALRIFNLSNPYNTVALFMVALVKFNENPELSMDMIRLLKGEKFTNYDVQFIKKRISDRNYYLARAYFLGAFPNNNYTPDDTYIVRVAGIEDSFVGQNHITAYVKTSGADELRPITLVRKGNRWYISEYSAILSQIRKPM